MSELIAKNILIGKARGFTNSIQRMDEKQKSQRPSGEYGSDYNTLRELVRKHYPSLAELLPPLVHIYRGSSGERTYTTQSYSEIDTFCQQIIELLSSINETVHLSLPQEKSH